MAKFLNTSAASYFLEELINSANEKIIIISPYLKINDRIKELLEDKNRLKIDIRVVYGKSDLSPNQIEWLQQLDFIRTSFCKNLHAKCYMNEKEAIITSLNLYEFSQVNNNEMGIHFSKEDDHSLYIDAYEEANRIIRISDEFKVTAHKVSDGIVQLKASLEKKKETPSNTQTHIQGNSVATIQKPILQNEIKPSTEKSDSSEKVEKLTTSKLAQKLKYKTSELNEKLLSNGYILKDNKDKLKLTQKGQECGATERSGKHGHYILWPSSLTI